METTKKSLNVKIEKDLHDKLKIHAAKKHRYITDIIVEALEEIVK